MTNHKSDIAIVTTTLYTDLDDEIQRVRSQLAIEAIAYASQSGYSVYVLDSGSPSSFVSGLIDAKASVLIAHESDMLEARQRVVRMALDDDKSHVVWTEPEKDVSAWVDDWAKAAKDHDAIAVLPMRMSTASYPLAQQHSERLGNQDLAEFFRREMGDWYFGPRLFTAAGAEKYWLTYDGSHGEHGRLWPSIFSPMFNALASGEHIVAVNTLYEYPSRQARIEMGDKAMEAKRLVQRSSITQAAKCAFADLDPSAIRFTVTGGFALANQGISISESEAVSSQV